MGFNKSFQLASDQDEYMKKFQRQNYLRGTVDDGYIFELKEEHIKLIQHMYYQFDESAYEGAPSVNLKRPFGNSDLIGDIMDILEFEPSYMSDICFCEEDDCENFHEDDELEISDSEREYLMDIYQGTHIALKIITQLKTFETGKYICNFHNTWEESNAMKRVRKIDSVLDDKDKNNSEDSE
jgi:hypothetical protein